ncbi:MAG: hypothetical protein HY795_01170 [Desulfovibrio sp.]|jgi:hypothetical protein|nr:hypothetical protein [Desulfovibrio sp.]
MKTCFSLEAVSPVRFTAAALSAAAVWLLVPELALAAVTFGDIGQNVADSAKGVAKGVTMAGFASGAGMGVWGCIDLYKASKSQSGQSGNYAPGVAKVVIGALALGIGEFLGSGSATLFGSDQTTGLDELGLR